MCFPRSVRFRGHTRHPGGLCGARRLDPHSSSPKVYDVCVLSTTPMFFARSPRGLVVEQAGGSECSLFRCSFPVFRGIGPPVPSFSLVGQRPEPDPSSELPGRHEYDHWISSLTDHGRSRVTRSFRRGVILRHFGLLFSVPFVGAGHGEQPRARRGAFCLIQPRGVRFFSLPSWPFVFAPTLFSATDLAA